MPTITSIKPQKNNKRVNIYLDGDFAFGLDLENFVKHNLRVEQELSQEEIDAIKYKGEVSKVFAKVLRFAMMRPRSKKELDDWFKRKKIELPLYAPLLKRLKKFELIDDTKFAQWWVGQRIQFKNKSKKELQFELRKKGIANDIIRVTLDSVEIDESKSAYDLLLKRSFQWKRFETDEVKNKMYGYLMRKGFGWDTVKSAVEKYLGGAEDE